MTQPNECGSRNPNLDHLPPRPSPNPPYSPPRSATPSTPSSPPTYGAVGGAAMAPEGDPLEIDCPACRLQVTPPLTDSLGQPHPQLTSAVLLTNLAQHLFSKFRDIGHSMNHAT